MEAAIVFGITAALRSGITLEGDHVVRANLYSCQMLRIDEAPMIGPVIADAIFAATCERLRKLPLDPSAPKQAIQPSQPT